MKKIYVIFLLVFTGVLTNVSAQLLQWNTFSNTGLETTEPSVFNDPNLSGITNLTLGSVTPASNGSRFGGSGWFNTGNTVGGNTLVEAVAGNDYIQFIVTPNSGFSFTPTSLVFTWDRSPTGPSSATLRSSADGFISDLGTVTSMTSGGASTTTTRTITITTLTNISTATTFRLYGYAASGTSGTGGFDCASSVVNVQLNGTTASTGGSLITVTPTALSGFTSSPGVPSAEQTYTVGGTGLTNNIVIAPPAGFEISLTTGAGFVAFPGTITLAQSSGNVPTTTIFVRMNSTTIGTNTGNITQTSAGSNNPTVALTGNVVPLVPIAYLWIGLTSDWQVPTNWAPARLFSATNDSLLFKTTTNLITNVPTQTVGYIGASLSTATTLQAAATGNTLTIGDLSGFDFFVEAGSSFNISSANALTLNLVTGATASISGAMTFTAGAHKLTAANASAVTFNSGAVFMAGTGFTGNAFGTNPASANSVVFTSGSTYRYTTGGNPFFLTQPSSIVVFQTGSLYKHESILNPSVSGRTYANFELDAPALTPIFCTGLNLLTIDNLTITNGSISFGMTTGGFDLKGNIIVTSGDTLRFAPASTGTLTFKGTPAQSITNAGTLSFNAFQNVAINNAAGLTLNAPIKLLDTLKFISGLVYTTATNLLTMDTASAVTGASNASFVFGPVKKIGNTIFTFPVGKANGYVPIEISMFVGGTIADEFTAEYIRSSARALGPVNAPPGLVRVSGCDYWTLVKGIATPTSLDVKAYWDANNPCGQAGSYITNTAFLTIARFDNVPNEWNSYAIPAIVTGGSTNAVGSITWPGATLFGPLSLASTSFGDNPLPITINYFNGTRNNGNHLLNWKVTCISTPSATIELERSIDGRNYNSIYSIFATAVRCQQPFDHDDNAPAKGVNYYRLKMTDVDGKVTYSSIISLINASKGMDVMNIAPNPIVNGAFNLKISTAEKMQMELVVIDMQGRVMMKQAANMIAGFNVIPVNVKQLAAGTYQLFGNTADGRTRVLRFVIQ